MRGYNIPVSTPDFAGKRIILLGAETALGAAVASALAAARASLALIGASNDAESAFAVQRLARRLGASVSQAIDATNEMAVRVMVRQASKALGGLDFAVVALNPASDESVAALARRFCSKEMNKRGGGAVAIVWPGTPTLLMPGDSPSATRVTNLSSAGRAPEEVTREVISALAAPSR